MLLAILAAVAALVVLSLVLVFARGEPVLLDESTPEGVVQRYAAAVIEGDEAAAATYLTEAARRGCRHGEHPAPENLRVVLVSTTVREDTADVKVSLVSSAEGGPFGPSEYAYDDVFDLARVDGRWLIDTAPWQLAICGSGAVTR
ncbi:hypothetical protein NCCP1664_07240 [Zafaria cholistanensis]|uniref:Lipoprotein LpqB N-terminal domain-containing protein n=1 Tax=Zafaria cholistanensis TaxID=1682741 RepID=A0A5A7NQG6_9MICC|nr:hypothetical protein NCCP1664_07240 [Zafaria cholistanensis]